MEFNPINNINTLNFANQKAGIVQSNKEQNAYQNLQQQPQTQTPLQNQTINPSLMYDFQLAKMDSETMLKYLQNLMKLPNNIEKFINQLNNKNIDPKLASILAENMISVKMLGNLLSQNSNEAISKLMQTISQCLKSGANDVNQLKEILSILNTIQNSSSLNTNTIKEFLLLYVPFSVPIFDKNIDGEISNEEENEAIKNSKLSILFETINYSNILVAINELENDILVDIFSIESFPKGEFKRLIEALSKEANINPLFEFKNKQANEITSKIQNFKIISDGFISPNTLFLAHLIIQTILKLDN